MGNLQTSILLSILALIRYIMNDLPIEYLQDEPNKRFVLVLLGIWAFYNLLKHNGFLPKKNISRQHVFITGGAMGIGRQFALQFAKKNCKITIVDINTEAGEKVVQEIKKFNKNIQIFKCDVTSVEQIAEVGKKCEQEFGPVDILINNAGIVTGKKLLDNTHKGIDMTFNVNAVSHAYTVKQFLPGMIKRNKGHVVTIASILGHIGVAGLSDYCGSKFANVGFNESLRMELQSIKSNVKTTCICPYQINTGMFDGMKNSFIMNLLLPILSEEYVGKRVLTAVRQDETLVMIPFMLYLLYLVKSTVPIPVSDFIADVLGINKSMDNFKGRKQTNKTT